MRLTVIGCSGSYPGPASANSCYLLEHDDGDRTWRVLLDLGSGALGTLQQYVDPLAIDAVLLTHLHADHCLDLCGYYVLRKYHPDGQQPVIPVYGPAGTAGRMARAYDLPPRPGMSKEFDFREYDGQPIRLGPFKITSTRVDHPVAAFALRVATGGGELVYSGDTGPCPELVKAARGADMLLAEASFLHGQDNPPHLHLTGRQAAEAAAAAEVGRLVLTHIPPWHDPQKILEDARPAYSGSIALAKVGDTYEL